MLYFIESTQSAFPHPRRLQSSLGGNSTYEDCASLKRNQSKFSHCDRSTRLGLRKNAVRINPYLESEKNQKSSLIYKVCKTSFLRYRQSAPESGTGMLPSLFLSTGLPWKQPPSPRQTTPLWGAEPLCGWAPAPQSASPPQPAVGPKHVAADMPGVATAGPLLAASRVPRLAGWMHARRTTSTLTARKRCHRPWESQLLFLVICCFTICLRAAAVFNCYVKTVNVRKQDLQPPGEVLQSNSRLQRRPASPGSLPSSFHPASCTLRNKKLQHSHLSCMLTQPSQYLVFH